MISGNRDELIELINIGKKGLSVALHFGADNPAPNVTAAVVTASNASTAAAIVELDIK